MSEQPRRDPGRVADVADAPLHRYDAFMSYSHAADHQLAPQLQRALKRYAKSWSQRRALEVYRDRTGLSVTSDLWHEISSALDDSRWFVLMASPEAAASEWVGREIARWRETHGVDRLLPVVTSGDWEWDPVRGDFDPDTSTAVHPGLLGAFDVEPYYLDLRWARNRSRLTLRDPRFREAVSEIAAPIHGRSRDDLDNEDIRQQRRVRRSVQAAVLVLVVLLIASSLGAVVAVRQRDEARRQTAIATARELAADSGLLLTTRLDQAMLLASAAYRLDPDPVTALALSRAAQASPHLVRYLNVDAKVTTLAGAARGGTVVAGLQDGELIRWPDGAGEPLRLNRFPKAVREVSMSDDGAVVLASDGTRVWCGPGCPGLHMPSLGKGEEVESVAVSPTGRTVAVHLSGRTVVATASGQRIVADPSSDQQTAADASSGSSDLVYQYVAVTDDHLTLLDGGYGGWAQIQLDPTPSVTASGVIGFGIDNYAVALSPDGGFASYTNSATQVPVWRLEPGADIDRPPLVGRSAGRAPEALALAPGGARLAVADAGTIDVSRPGPPSAAPQIEFQLTGNPSIDTLAFAGPDRLLSGTDSRIALWDLDQPSRVAAVYPFEMPSSCVACSPLPIWPSPDGRSIATGPVLLDTGAVVHLLAGAAPLEHAGRSSAWTTPRWRADSRATLLPDGKGDVVVTDPATQRALHTIPTGLDQDSLLDFGMNPAGTALTVFGSDGEIRVLDPRDGHVIRNGPMVPELRSDDIRDVTISDRLDQLLVLGNQQSWYRDLRTGKVRTLPGLHGGSFGGNVIAYARVDDGAGMEIRDTRTWRLIRTDPGPILSGPALSPDGRLYALQRDDGTVEVHQVASGDLLLSLELPSSLEELKTSLAFSRDGRRLFTTTEPAGTGPGQAEEWILDPRVQSASDCGTAGRDLSPAEVTALLGTIPPGLGTCSTALGPAPTASVDLGW